MKAISVRQPFAWLIVSGKKPIENRNRTTRYRGPLIIHASQQWHDVTVDEVERRYGVRIDRTALRRGGIVGRVDLVDVVTTHPSIWFRGKYGLVLKGATRTNFIPLSGKRGIFDVPPDLVRLLRRA